MLYALNSRCCDERELVCTPQPVTMLCVNTQAYLPKLHEMGKQRIPCARVLLADYNLQSLALSEESCRGVQGCLIRSGPRRNTAE
eukprot:5609904-Amphidinium_carterae.1